MTKDLKARLEEADAFVVGQLDAAFYESCGTGHTVVGRVRSAIETYREELARLKIALARAEGERDGLADSTDALAAEVRNWRQEAQLLREELARLRAELNNREQVILCHEDRIEELEMALNYTKKQHRDSRELSRKYEAIQSERRHNYERAALAGFCSNAAIKEPLTPAALERLRDESRKVAAAMVEGREP